MIFSSLAFIFIFLPLAIAAFRASATFFGRRATVATVVLASLVFYGVWEWRYLLLIVPSIGVNFMLGSLIARTGSRGLLTIGVVANLLLLVYFKYAGFVAENTGDLFGLLPEGFSVALPLGISFFTLQQIAYLVDCSRDRTAETRLGSYSLFVSFFPQLIAGPIVHHKDMLPQFSKPSASRFLTGNFLAGCMWFSFGLFRKVVLADTMVPWVSDVFDGSSPPDVASAWFGALAYTVQIYFDFSGYCDMAIGLGLMFNIRLPDNFNAPYRAASIVDFWRRWHMTLSRFLRDYVYIPLGGNRKGPARRYVNLMLTMLIGGLWHGAAWTFVAWGALHGAMLCVNHLSDRLRLPVPKLAGWALTMLGVVVGWVLFRATSFERAGEILSAMAFVPAEAAAATEFATRRAWITLGVIAAFAVVLPTTRESLTNRRIGWLTGGLAGLAFVISIFLLREGLIGDGRPTEFIYFQF